MAQLATEQAPVWATLAIAPTIGLTLMGTQSAGTISQYGNWGMQPFPKQTTFGQKKQHHTCTDLPKLVLSD
jgi:hypothetical protein